MDMEVFWDGEQHRYASLSSATQDPRYQWGPQPPSFEGNSNITKMKDKDDLAKGPAYFFQKSFDKIVVLRDQDLHFNTMKRSVSGARDDQDRRGWEERDAAADAGKFPMPTDKPWFCFWNGTVLEVFLFVTQNATDTAETAAYESSSASVITEPGDDSSIPAPPVGTPITSSVGPAYASTTTAAWYHKRQNTGSATFPNVIKVEERRNTLNPQPPYCQKMQIMNDGTPSPLTDGAGNLIFHPLNETEPDVSNGLDNRRRSWIGIFGSMRKRDASADDGCQCQWQIT